MAAAYDVTVELTPRQAAILKAVVLECQATGRPVGSRTIVELGIVAASPSTVRSEFARLEQLGLLQAPHTSAGRVPTDTGYRMYVDALLDTGETARMPALVAHLGVEEAQIDDALRHTTQILAEATRLLAVVSAPQQSGSVVRHIEVLQLQGNRLVVVCITETGDVTRHVVQTDYAIDPGLVRWAGEYLNDQVTGMALGQNILRQRLQSPDLSNTEQEMLALLAPAFIELVEAGTEVYVGGSQALASRLGADVSQVVALVGMLDERRRLLAALQALAPGRAPSMRGVSVRIGSENDFPELRELSLIGATYGLPARSLGVVGLIGPRSLDYPYAMAAVGEVADTLSDLAQNLYAG